MPRPRKHHLSIPPHIDQSKIPKGIYWDSSGKGRWYVLEIPRKAVAVAGPSALLSDLHSIMEARSGAHERGTIGHVITHYLRSTDFQQLAPRTQEDYHRQVEIVRSYKTTMGMTLDRLHIARMSPAIIQRIVEKIAVGNGEIKGKPTKANHLFRFLRLVFSWGIRHGHCMDNPAKGVRQAPERKRDGMPTLEAFAAILQFATRRGRLKAHTAGSVPRYIAPLMYIAYACRLRGIEAMTLTEANATEHGILSNRRKRSRDNITRWTPRLRQAWAELLAHRAAVLKRNCLPQRLHPQDRYLVLAESGHLLTKSGLDTAWQRLMALAIQEKVILDKQRFTLHGIKHRGITDSTDKSSGGHRSESMRQRYDHALPIVEPASALEFSGVFSGEVDEKARK
ncbi:site-specific integrase [Xylella fastidiosa]|uniref:site-specific integrase n=1 Tax=Xylella fastidiosa TaxID=2371 RepID=UPI000765DAD9|nr:hypothetical protein [Xylella fastidiosa]KXB13278.1 hypothetical protein ADT29_08130 [Xylella fastidiosa]KXB21950.1 hypothetical protein ADT28_03460 [Xylella fastidiosa]